MLAQPGSNVNQKVSDNCIILKTLFPTQKGKTLLAAKSKYSKSKKILTAQGLSRSGFSDFLDSQAVLLKFKFKK
jgi:hypothetical protein